MESITLYRKYRPAKFTEIVGQGHIVDSLKNSIENGKISHAYLFSGSRGIGKTSIARIFADKIGTDSDDLYEMDAASQTGIDDIRELTESVHTLPYKSKYKVYIIDEVHMLSKQAFNGLLKTLEEPPEHVIFILATTEIEKLPETVVSRCQNFVFKKPSDEVVSKHLISVAKKEGVSITEDASILIALVAEGSFRDALGILQKVLATHNDKSKKIEADDVAKVCGAPKSEIVNKIILGVSRKSPEDALEVLANAVRDNVDMKTLLNLILYKLRIVLLLKYAPQMKKDLEQNISIEEKKIFDELLSDKSVILDSKMLVSFLDAGLRINTASVPSIAIEIAILEICESK